ncbi:Ig-like domain-containing protein, partial [Psychrobacter sp. SZ93C1]|uniref:Ig-like domain-containing protein n=1 Tax=Psychrobacter sp. SZ93C1 TaxID=2792058 RepID=UPI002A0A61FF
MIDAVTGDDIINGIEAEAGFTVTGTGTAGDTITLTNEAGVQIGQPAIVDIDGNWSVAVVAADVAAMGEGAEQLTATATDPVGNLSTPATKDISVDSTAPTAPVIDSFDGTIVVGTAEAGSTVDILDA